MEAIHYLDTVLEYPKYRGKTVKEVCEYNANYLLWLMASHPEDFELAPEVFNYIESLPYGKTSNYLDKKRKTLEDFTKYHKFVADQIAIEEAEREHLAEMKMYEDWTRQAYM